MSAREHAPVHIRLHPQSFVVPISFTRSNQININKEERYLSWKDMRSFSHHSLNSGGEEIIDHTGPSKYLRKENGRDIAGAQCVASSSASSSNRRLNDIVQLTRQVYVLFHQSRSFISIIAFAIDKKWLDKWLDSMLSDQLSSGDAFEGIPLSGISDGGVVDPICNDHLVDNKSNVSASSEITDTTVVVNLDLKIKAGLRVDTDYYLVCNEVWTALHGWYGGGPVIPIKVTFEIKLDDTSIDSSQLASSASESKIDEILDKCITLSSEKLGKLVSGAFLNVEGVDISDNDGIKKVSSNASRKKPSNLALNLDYSTFEGYIWRDCGDEKKTSAEEKPVIIEGKKFLKSLCFVCHEKSKFVCSVCKSFYYCTTECQKMHWDLSHSKLCPRLKGVAIESCRTFASQFLFPMKGLESGLGKRGKMGIRNIGNSCYLSSAMQCLLRITPINYWMISADRFKKHLNPLNRMGTGGALTNEYHEILKNFWLRPATEIINPTSFKRILGSINQDYGDLSQQDAHDVTLTILEKMHEDLNRVSKKPLVEAYEKIVSANGDAALVNDEEVAAECWRRHLQREDSVIQDVVGGLVKIQKRCLTCKSRTITFDYQQTIQLPIPSNALRKIPITIIPILSPDQSLSFSASNMGSKTGNNSSLYTNRISPFPKPLSLTLSVDTTSKVSTFQLLAEFVEDEASSTKAPNSIGSSIGSSAFNLSSYLSHFCGSFHPTHPNKRNNMTDAYIFKDSFRCLRLPFNSSLPVNLVNLKDIESFETSKYRYVLVDSNSCMPITPLDFSVYIVQRIITPGSSDLKTSSFPMLIKLDANTTVERLRLHIFQQVERSLLKKSGGLWDRYKDKCSSGNILKAQTEMASYLNISVLEWSGKPYFPPKSVAAESKGIHDLGVLLPNKSGEAKVKFVDFKSRCEYKNDIVFLSVNWLMDETSDSWKVDEQEIDSLFIHSSSRKLISSENAATLSSASTENFESTVGYSNGPIELPWKISNNHDVKWDLHFLDRLTLDTLFEEYVKTEVLSDNNAVYCGAICKSHQPHERSFKLFKSRLPKTLIIHIKRFEVRDVSGNAFSFLPLSNRRKLDDFIGFPLEGLDVGKYCETETNSGEASSSSSPSPSSLTSSSSSSSGVDFALSDSMDTVYDLFGVVNHYGRLGFGHYTAYVRDYCKDRVASNWIVADDHKVNDVDPSEVVSKDAYILFYKSRNA